MTQRKVLSLGDFRGVDFSTSPLNVKPYRAAEAVNFINDYGKTRKRPGWRERLVIEEDGRPVRINGIFNYENGEHSDVIVHAGRRFYRLYVDAATGRELAEDITSSGTYAPSAVDPDRLTDTRSQAVYNRKRLYIIGCGDYLVYGSWNGGESYELRRVYSDEDTYIPTTSIGIDAVDYFNGNAPAGASYEVLDDANYMTAWRKNKLQGVTVYDTGTTSPRERSRYYLDATIDEGTIVTLVNEMTGEIWSNEGASVATQLINEEGVVGGTIGFAEGFIQLKSLRSDNPITTSWPADNGDSVLTVTFMHTPTAEEAGLSEEDFVPYADRVGLCQFGAMFGVSGNTDRLFVSGNERLPNIDFFSEADDLTYFPDLNTVAMGSDAQAVVGYARLSDNTLAIFKERVGGADASIFYRTGYLSEQYDDRGNLEKLLPVFPTVAGNIGEAVISRHACVDFGGDNLILSRGGVFGIVLADNVATAVRYTRERSRNVNALLCAEDNLAEAVGYSFDGRYYLAVNGHCYVADARYKISVHDDMDGSYQYEWWYWDGIPARVFSELSGALIFGTEDGKICELDAIGKGEAADRTMLHLEAGDLSLDVANNQLDFNATLPFTLSENDRITITTRGVFALYAGDILSVDGERIFVGEEAILGILEGERVYIDGECGLAAHVAYVVDDVDAGECSFRLLTEDGVAVVPSGTSFRLLIEISRRVLFVTKVGTADFGVKLYPEGEALVLTDYAGEVPLLPQASICHRKPIFAAWYTPVFDLGAPSREKSIHRLTMTAEPGIVGKLSFGFDTRRERHMREGGESRGFSFDSLNFRDFAFTTGFASSLTKRIFVRGFNYIQFRFVSEGDTDASIGAFEAEYSILTSKGGLR